MAELTGDEPISAANLKAALGGVASLDDAYPVGMILPMAQFQIQQAGIPGTWTEAGHIESNTATRITFSCRVS